MAKEASIVNRQGVDIAVLQTQFKEIDEKLDAQGEDIRAIAARVADIHNIMARQGGVITAVRYVTHASAGIIGGFISYLGINFKH